MEDYRVNIVGLSNKVHHFDFAINDGFFNRLGKDIVSKGSFVARVTLDKHETFMEVTFDITGAAKLICDRSLDPFDYPVELHKLIVFKYGDEDQEINDEIMIIHRDTVSLELGQFIYEFIGLAIPMKKLHPRFSDDRDTNGDELIYSSVTEEKKTEDTDPRWEILKKLK